jgi:hypothetical protein
MLKINIRDVLLGDIVRFAKYSLRVEKEPARGNGSIRLHGRISTDGSPLVTKQFMTGRMVTVERGALTRQDLNAWIAEATQELDTCPEQFKASVQLRIQELKRKLGEL